MEKQEIEKIISQIKTKDYTFECNKYDLVIKSKYYFSIFSFEQIDSMNLEFWKYSESKLIINLNHLQCAWLYFMQENDEVMKQ